MDEKPKTLEQQAEQGRFLGRILDGLTVGIAYLDRDLIYRQCNAAVDPCPSTP